MLEPRGSLPPSWEAVLFRSTTDRDFRDQLLRDPSALLRELGLLQPTHTVAVYEWSPEQHILVLPPLITEPLETGANLRRDLLNRRQGARRTGAETYDTSFEEAARQDAAARRAPYSDQSPSEPMIGPAVSALQSPVPPVPDSGPGG